MNIYYPLKEINDYPSIRALVLFAKMANVEILFTTLNLHRYIHSLGREYGVEVLVYNGESPVITINHPKELIDIIKKNEESKVEVSSYKPSNKDLSFKGGLRKMFKSKY